MSIIPTKIVGNKKEIMPQKNPAFKMKTGSKIKTLIIYFFK